MNGLTFVLKLNRRFADKPNVTAKKLDKKKRPSPSQRKRRSERKRIFLNEKQQKLQSDTGKPSILVSPRIDIDSDKAEITTQPVIIEAIRLNEQLVSDAKEVSKPSNCPTNKTVKCDHYGKRLLAFIWRYLQKHNELKYESQLIDWFHGITPVLWHVSTSKDIPSGRRNELLTCLNSLQTIVDKQNDLLICQDSAMKLYPQSDTEFDCLWCEPRLNPT
jgi:hypothetical protein